jgi:hypothetical protein
MIAPSFIMQAVHWANRAISARLRHEFAVVSGAPGRPICRRRLAQLSSSAADLKFPQIPEHRLLHGFNPADRIRIMDGGLYLHPKVLLSEVRTTYPEFRKAGHRA